MCVIHSINMIFIYFLKNYPQELMSHVTAAAVMELNPSNVSYDSLSKFRFLKKP